MSLVIAQVPGMGVQGLCLLPDGAAGSTTPSLVRFGSLEFVSKALRPGCTAGHALERAGDAMRSSAESRAVSFLTVEPHPAPEGESGCPTMVAVMCFEDVIQPGVLKSVHSLQLGAWGGAARDVVMLTGKEKGDARGLKDCWVVL